MGYEEEVPTSEAYEIAMEENLKSLWQKINQSAQGYIDHTLTHELQKLAPQNSEEVIKEQVKSDLIELERQIGLALEMRKQMKNSSWASLFNFQSLIQLKNTLIQNGVKTDFHLIKYIDLYLKDLRTELNIQDEPEQGSQMIQ